MIEFAFLFLSMSVGNLDQIELECYTKSMVGYDSVINSHFGVPAEHAIKLTQDESYRKIIWEAYLWKSSPHEFAIKTYSACIQQSGQ